MPLLITKNESFENHLWQRLQRFNSDPRFTANLYGGGEALLHTNELYLWIVVVISGTDDFQNYRFFDLWSTSPSTYEPIEIAWFLESTVFRKSQFLKFNDWPPGLLGPNEPVFLYHCMQNYSLYRLKHLSLFHHATCVLKWWVSWVPLHLNFALEN